MRDDESQTAREIAVRNQASGVRSLASCWRKSGSGSSVLASTGIGADSPEGGNRAGAGRESLGHDQPLIRRIAIGSTRT